MKQYLLLVLLLTGCSQMDNEKYEKAREVAKKAKQVDYLLGFGFQRGMTRKAAESKVEALRSTAGMSITLPSGSVLTSDLVEPDFGRDTLAQVTLRFLEATESQLTELQAMLTQRYGNPGFKHDDEVSWFSGPVEIELRKGNFEVADRYLSFLSYRDLRRYDVYLDEFGKSLDSEQLEKQKRQAAETQKL